MSMSDRLLFAGIYSLLAVGIYWGSGILAQRKLEAVFAEGRAQYVADQKKQIPTKPRPAVASLVK